MSGRVLIAIMSCRRHRSAGYNDAQRETWIKDIPAGTDHRFFLGLGEEIVDTKNDEVCVGVPDSYDTYPGQSTIIHGLPMKTRAICQWAWDGGYDFIYKTDTDTLVNVPNLLASGFEQHDYFGGENADNLPPSLYGARHIQFASGGAGYWLSRKAFDIVRQAKPEMDCGEDVYVAANLRNNGILPVWHAGYRWRPGDTVDESMVSLHLSSALQKKYLPSLMHEYYRMIR